MRLLIQTIGFSIAFTTIGSLTYDQARKYAERPGQRPSLQLPRGNPGIPEDIKLSLRQNFGR